MYAHQMRLRIVQGGQRLATPCIEFQWLDTYRTWLDTYRERLDIYRTHLGSGPSQEQATIYHDPVLARFSV